MSAPRKRNGGCLLCFHVIFYKFDHSPLSAAYLSFLCLYCLQKSPHFQYFLPPVFPGVISLVLRWTPLVVSKFSPQFFRWSPPVCFVFSCLFIGQWGKVRAWGCCPGDGVAEGVGWRHGCSMAPVMASTFLFLFIKFEINKLWQKRVFRWEKLGRMIFLFNFGLWFHPKSFVSENSDRLNLTQIRLPNLISYQLSP